MIVAAGLNSRALSGRASARRDAASLIPQCLRGSFDVSRRASSFRQQLRVRRLLAAGDVQRDVTGDPVTQLRRRLFDIRAFFDDKAGTCS